MIKNQLKKLTHGLVGILAAGSIAACAIAPETKKINDSYTKPLPGETETYNGLQVYYGSKGYSVVKGDNLQYLYSAATNECCLFNSSGVYEDLNCDEDVDYVCIFMSFRHKEVKLSIFPGSERDNLNADLKKYKKEMDVEGIDRIWKAKWR